MKSWEGYDLNQECLGSEGDKGDVLIVKSGTDFRELTSVDLELEDVPATTDGVVRRKLIKSIKGTAFEHLPRRILRCHLRTTDRDEARDATVSNSQGDSQVCP